MPPRAFSHSPSLLDGWLPWTLQALALLVLLLAVGWRTARSRRLPVVIAVGAAGAVAAWWWFRGSGLASDPRRGRLAAARVVHRHDAC